MTIFNDKTKRYSNKFTLQTLSTLSMTKQNNNTKWINVSDYNTHGETNFIQQDVWGLEESALDKVHSNPPTRID